MPNSWQDPWVKLTVESELIKFGQISPWNFTPEQLDNRGPQEHALSLRWLSCKPQKRRPSSFPQGLKNNPKTTSDLPRWGVNTEEPALLRIEKQTLFKCLDLQEISDNLLMFVLTLFQCVFVVQLLSHGWLFVTPWTAARQAPLSSTVAWSSLKFMSIELVMLFNHLILYHPFSFCLQSFPGMESLPESALCITWPKYWSFSFSISPSNEYSGLISFRNDWFDLLAVQRTLKSFLQPFLPLSLAGDDI